jgi:hypothetical protein
MIVRKITRRKIPAISVAVDRVLLGPEGLIGVCGLFIARDAACGPEVEASMIRRQIRQEGRAAGAGDGEPHVQSRIRRANFAATFRTVDAHQDRI